MTMAYMLMYILALGTIGIMDGDGVHTILIGGGETHGIMVGTIHGTMDITHIIRTIIIRTIIIRTMDIIIHIGDLRDIILATIDLNTVQVRNIVKKVRWQEVMAIEQTAEQVSEQLQLREEITAPQVVVKTIHQEIR